MFVLVVCVVVAVMAHGFLSSAVAQHAWRMRTVRDVRVLAGSALAVGLVLAYWQVAAEFARNPP